MSDSEKMWITLEDPKLVELILRSVGDEDKKGIINIVMNQPLTIAEIIEINKLPHTSGYRKINSLIDNGILIPREYITNDGKRIAKYQTVFETLLIAIEKNKVVLHILASQEFMKQSFTFKNLK